MVDIVDLFNASDQQLGYFRKIMEQSEGKLPIMVHPYFLEHTRGPLDSAAGYKRDRDQLIKRLLKNSYPLLILEEYERRSSLKARLNEAVPDNNVIVHTVYTETGGSLPRKPHTLSALGDLLIGLGVQSVEVGGVYMVLIRNKGLEDGLHLLKYDERTLFPVSNPNVYAQKLQAFRNALAGDRRDTSLTEWVGQVVPYGCAGLTAGRLLHQGLRVSLSTCSYPGYSHIFSQEGINDPLQPYGHRVAYQ